MNTTSATLAALTLTFATSLAAPPTLSPVQLVLHRIDADIQPDHYAVARADLDGDGKEDVLALMNGRSGYCGSGGCTLFILKGTDEGFAEIGAVKVVNPPIYLRATSHRGLRDLLVRVRGGGVAPDFAALEFDGTSYPAGAGKANKEVQGTDTMLFADPQAIAFDRTVELFGVTFHVTSSASTGKAKTVTVTPTGLERDNTPMMAAIEGEVTGVEVADLNVDHSPEVYVYVRSTEGRKVGSVVAFAANGKKSLTRIHLPDLAEDAKNSAGYRGGDEFAVVESTFARRFPIYPEDRRIAEPTGKMRQLQYKLKAGEAGWTLEVDKAIEF